MSTSNSRAPNDKTKVYPCSSSAALRQLETINKWGVNVLKVKLLARSNTFTKRQ